MWINTTTLGEFVLHADIRYELWKSGKEAPAVLTDEYLASVGYAVLTPVYPAYDPITRYLAPRTGALVNGVWEKHYDVLALDPAIVLNNQNQQAAQAQNAILAQLQANDIKIIRALVEGDQPRIDAHKAAQAALRTKIK